MKLLMKVMVVGIVVFVMVGVFVGCMFVGDGDGVDGCFELCVVMFLFGVDVVVYDVFVVQEKQFEKEYFDIDIIGVEYEWEGFIFVVQFVGGSLFDVFIVLFIDFKMLFENGQLMDVIDVIEEFGYMDKFNFIIFDGVIGVDGKIYGFLWQVYVVVLYYNCDLFEQVGFDFDSFLEMWDEICEVVKKIMDVIGKVGYVQMVINNIGGWQFMLQIVVCGGCMQSDNGDGIVELMIDNDVIKIFFQFLYDVKWEDNVFGLKVDFDWGIINQEFVVGNIGMYIFGFDIYIVFVCDFGMDLDIYGMIVVFMEGDDFGMFGGGDIVVISFMVDDVIKEVVVIWIDWYYMQKFMDKDVVVFDVKILNELGQVVGILLLLVFSWELYDELQEWIVDYINVLVDQMVLFSDCIWDQMLVGELKVKMQEVYVLFDIVVQKVLIDQNVDIDVFLVQVQSDVQVKFDEQIFMMMMFFEQWVVVEDFLLFVVCCFCCCLFFIWFCGGGFVNFLFVFLMFFVFVFFLWLLIVQLVVMSLQKINLIVFEWVGFDNYFVVIGDFEFGCVVINMLWFVVFVLFFGFLLLLLMVVFMSEVCCGKGIYFVFVYFLVVIFLVVVVLLWKFFYSVDLFGVFNIVFGFVGIFLQLWIQDVVQVMFLFVFEVIWVGVGGLIIIYFVVFLGVLFEFYDVVEVDGVGIWKKVWYVMLLQLCGIFFIMLILQVIVIVQVFFELFLFIGGGFVGVIKIVLLYIYDKVFWNSLGGDYGEVMVVLVLLVIVFVFFFWLYFKLIDCWSMM